MKRGSKKGLSLLTVLLLAALVETTATCGLIFGVINRSVDNLENFTIENKQQETQAIVTSLEQDMNSLMSLLYRTMSDSTLSRLYLYLDSSIVNYRYIEIVHILQEQLQTIVNSQRITENVEIYLPEYQRMISVESLKRFNAQEEAPWLDEMLENSAQRLYCQDNEALFYVAQQSASYRRNVVVVARQSTYGMQKYLQSFMPSDDSSFVTLFVREDEPRFFASSSRSFDSTFCAKVCEIISASESGSQQCTFDDNRYLITWGSTTLPAFSVCQITTMEIIDSKLRSYQYMAMTVCIASIALMVMLTLFMYNTIRNPIRQMITALRQVESNDLSVRMSSTWSREFQHIFGQFNQMTEKLQNLINQEYRLKLLHVNAELKQLRYQISPHFLYNTYFNMRAMLHDEEYDTAEKMADLMGRYLRYITTSVQDEATIRQEMDHSIAYLEIQKLRFGSRLETRVKNCPAWAESRLIPRIVIQPLIENAFEHGIRNQEGTDIISVEVQVELESLSIIVEDNGTMATDEAIEKLQRRLQEGSFESGSDAVALMNIQCRIQMLYAPGSGLLVSRSPLGGIRFEIRLIGEKKHVSDVDR